MTINKKKEIDYKERVLEEVKEILNLLGNKILCDIFENYSDSSETLFLKLREYNNALCMNLREFEAQDGEEDEDGIKRLKSTVQPFIYLNGVCIDAKNISRIEFGEDYNIKKHSFIYNIIITKKYPSPNEEFFIIPFLSEENRDLGFDILRMKLKICGIEIF